MPLEIYLGFAAATLILMLIPGPNVALIVANSVAHGARYGLLTVAGTASAMVVQLVLTLLGTGALLATLASWFECLRWLGVAYLIWLGVKAWRASPADLGGITPLPRALRTIWPRGFLVSLTNPKTLLFYGAFLPQFVSREADPMAQMLLLTATYLAIALLVDSGWALLASRTHRLVTAGSRLRNRISGGFLIGAGFGLALARKP
ncbi:LysE family translocator [Emcibacter sp. SYSU 3D8]|uniref:LysE family translocator n=1 Tax=Emcibacter sp. SYSU 3D8 TaxID=3133969 RepID=UPI0031FE4503